MITSYFIIREITVRINNATLITRILSILLNNYQYVNCNFQNYPCSIENHSYEIYFLYDYYQYNFDGNIGI